MQSKESLEQPRSRNVNDYAELIETLARVEYSRLSAAHLIDYSELVNIAAIAVHVVLTTHKSKEFNISYLSTAARWAIRNELRRRYRWYSFRSTSKKEEVETTEDDEGIQQEEIREAIYETILSVDDLADGENPTQLKDDAMTPDENCEFRELSKYIKTAISKLPTRERFMLESRFYKGKKIREIADELKISPSRCSRIIQAGLDKVKHELQKTDLFDDYRD